MSLCVLALAACGREDSPVSAELAPPAHEQPLADVRVRLMAANISSGNNQSYDPGHGTRIFQGTKPDVAMIQEFNFGSNSTADIRGFVDTAFGTNYSYYRGGGGVQIPNGVISRYPILAAGDWTDTQVGNRAFTWARIDVPGPKDLWAVSVHLLTSGAGVRNTEATNLTKFIQTNVPSGAFVVIGGDFNSDSRSEAQFSTFSSVVSTASPYPADKSGNDGTNASRSKPYDHVLVSSNLRSYQTSTVIGSSSFASGLVVDTRVYSPLSDISPAQSGDSGSTNMQHMAVVKDFLVPSDATTSGITVTSPNGGESWAPSSAHAITWTSSGVTSVKVEYSLNGSTWSTLTSSTSASSGSYAWTLPGTTSTSAWVRVSDASNSATTDSSNAAFSITSSGGGGGAAQVILNEILANEPGSDVNGEFIELYNAGGTAADLSGWTLWDATGSRHTFASGTSLAAGKALTVFGGTAGIPSGTVNAVGCSSGGLNLSNSGDTVTLKNASGSTVDSFTYGSSLSGSDGVSMNRSPDGTSSGSFVLHTDLSSATSSPGKRANGTAY